MKIAIIENEKELAEKLWGYFFDINDIDAKYYTSSPEFLNEYKNGAEYDVIFCDVVMEPINGIELGREIRKINRDVYIILMSNYIEYALMGYEIGVFRYLMKPVKKKDLLQVLSCIKEDFSHSKKICVKSNGSNIVLNQSSIVYIEVRNKNSYIYYYGSNGDLVTIITDRSLNQLEQELCKEDFFRIHRKYHVNMGHITDYAHNILTMDCKTTLPVSYRKFTEFTTSFFTYLQNR
ncbi:MAG: LytR/AlgR family response regulator transcription factor [Lachnospiraceae bacterium]